MISVVIPAYNEEDNIERCMDAFVAQINPPAYELILVDNNSTDSTVKIARQYLKKLPLTIVNQTIKGRGAARAAGCDCARGDIILSSDSDSIVPPNWISETVRILTSSDAVALSGTCCINDCDTSVNNRFNWFQPVSMRLYKILFGHYWLSGFNFAIYTDVYRRSGGFSTTLNAMEDVEIARRVSRLGKIIMTDRTCVIFSGRRFKRGLLRGIWPYIQLGIRYYMADKSPLYLSDIR